MGDMMNQQNSRLIKTTMNDKKITQREMAYFLGIDEAAFSRVLSGQRKLQNREAEILAIQLGIDFHEILAMFGLSSETLMDRYRSMEKQIDDLKLLNAILLNEIKNLRGQQ